MADAGWVRVSERLPERDGPVLVFAPSCDPQKPFLMQAWYDPAFGWSLLPAAWIPALTHWRELPPWPADYVPEES